MSFNFGGTPAAAAPGFGAAAAKPTGFSFGAAPAPNTTAPALGGFGAPATSAPAFGAFGAPAAKLTTAAPTLGGFGAPAATAAPTLGGFGAPAATAAPTLGGFGAAAPTLGGFGAPAATAAPALGLGGFGAASSTAPKLGGFGAPAATTAPTLGGFGAPAAAAVPTLGGFGAAATTVAPTLGSFGAAASTAAPTLGGFGASASTAPTLGGFGAATTTTAPTLGGFGGAALSTAPTSTAASVGLGGSTTVPSFGLGGQTQQANQTSADAKTEVKNVKEGLIPSELGQTVGTIKKHIKDEKSIMSDISHVSDKQYKKIQEETDALAQLVTLLTSGIHKNRSALENLKLASAQELMNVEIAQRTKETPPSMQYENVGPMEYFVRLVSQFESDMSEYRKQIDQTQQHLQLMGSGGGVTSGDIAQAVQKLHAAFTELAARYQMIHQTLAVCKEEFVAVHRRKTGSSVQAFERKSTSAPRLEPSLSKLSGPSPFSAPSDPLVQARAVLPNKNQQTGGLGPPTLGLNTTATPAGAFGSFSGNQSFGAFGAANTSNFGNTSGFGGNTSGFGGNTTGFGGNTSGFGGNTSAFAGNTSAFGGNTSGFGGNNTTFGGFSNNAGFGSSTLIGSPTNKRNKI